MATPFQGKVEIQKTGTTEKTISLDGDFASILCGGNDKVGGILVLNVDNKSNAWLSLGTMMLGGGDKGKLVIGPANIKGLPIIEPTI
jgi:hypothetical protein